MYKYWEPYTSLLTRVLISFRLESGNTERSFSIVCFAAVYVVSMIFTTLEEHDQCPATDSGA